MGKAMTTRRNHVASLVLLMFLSTAAIQVVSSLWLTITPPHMRIRPNVIQHVTCQANTAIAACHFKLWQDGRIDDLPLINFTTPDQIVGWNIHTEYLVDGRRTNLTNGKCDMSLRNVTAGRYVIGCRVRGHTGNWHYKQMTLDAFNSGEFSDTRVTIAPEDEVIVAQGSNVDITCTSNANLDRCLFRLPRDPSDWKKTTSSVPNQYSVGENIYYRICRVSLYNVTESDAGVVWCQWVFQLPAYRKSLINEFRGTTFIVQKPPTEPPKLVLSKTSYVVGETLEATCTVMESVPPANITWYWGSSSIESEGREIISKNWTWSWQAARRKQILRKNLTAEDHGKNVTCVATHMGTNVTLQSSTIIHVKEKATTVPVQPSQATSTTTLPTGGTYSDPPDEGNAGNSTGARDDFPLSTVIIASASVAVFLVVMLAILIVARVKHYWCFKATTSEHEHAIYKKRAIPTATGASRVDLLRGVPQSTSATPEAVYSEVVPRDARAATEKTSSVKNPRENVVYAEVLPRDARAGAAQTSSVKNAPESVVYAEVIPRDARAATEKTSSVKNPPENVVYAEVLPRGARVATKKTFSGKKAPEIPEYAEIDFQ